MVLAHWAQFVIVSAADLPQRIDGLVQERRNSSALAMELRLSCTNPLAYDASLLCGNAGPFDSVLAINVAGHSNPSSHVPMAHNTHHILTIVVKTMDNWNS